MPSVLFLCNHNSARSQMAEAMVRYLAGGNVRVRSAGLGRKEIKPTVFTVMEEIGISLDGQYSKTIEEIGDSRPFDYAITVCKTDENECPRFSEMAKVHLSWEIESPFRGRRPADLDESEKLIHYRSLRDQVRSRVSEWLEEIGLAQPYEGV